MSAEKTILALDTATRQATVAVCRGSRILAESGREVTTHSEGLLDLIDETLQRAGVAVTDLDAIACGRGPGSFTGLRIGLATVKGLCLATGAPLIAISSLLPLAAAAVEALGEVEESLVAAVLDARREEVFLGLYRGLELLGPECVLRPEDLPAALPDDQPAVLAGDGAQLYWDQLSELLGDRASMAPEGCHAIQARYLCIAALPRLAAADFDDLEATVPLYIRPSDAKLPQKGWGLGRRGRHGRSAADEKARAPDGPAEEVREAVDPELIERLRQSGLRLDREGRWWHEGSMIEHPRIARMLHLWLDRLDDGRYVVRFDERDETLFAYVEVEDAPFVVRTVELDKGAAGHVEVHLHLSDERIEELDYASLSVGADNALYCRVREGRFDALFSRQAYYLIGELVEEDPLSGGFALRAVGRLWSIQVRTAPRAADE